MNIAFSIDFHSHNAYKRDVISFEISSFSDDAIYSQRVIIKMSAGVYRKVDGFFNRRFIIHLEHELWIKLKKQRKA